MALRGYMFYNATATQHALVIANTEQEARHLLKADATWTPSDEDTDNPTATVVHTPLCSGSASPVVDARREIVPDSKYAVGFLEIANPA